MSAGKMSGFTPAAKACQWVLMITVVSNCLAFCDASAASGVAQKSKTPEIGAAACSTNLVDLYIHTLKTSVTGILLQTPSIEPGMGNVLKERVFDMETRQAGADWPVSGLTMVGLKRLDNLQEMMSRILQKDIAGDVVECGVWRGGASLFMKGLMKAYSITDRTIHLVDSFKGLPMASTMNDTEEWSRIDYLRPQVKSAFERYNLLDEQVAFHEGYFRHSLPKLRKQLIAQGASLALLRLDGDMFESTYDILYNLGDLVSPEGCFIVDDWSIINSRRAVEGFFRDHGLQPEIIHIDKNGAYFCIDKRITLQHKVYEDFNAARTE